MMTRTDKLMQDIIAFCHENGISKHKFGLLVANNHKLFDRVQKDKVNSSTINKIDKFINDYNGQHPSLSKDSYK